MSSISKKIFRYLGYSNSITLTGKDFLLTFIFGHGQKMIFLLYKMESSDAITSQYPEKSLNR